MHGLADVAGLDQACELRGSGDVRPLADHLEVAVGPYRQRLEPGKLRVRLAGQRRGGIRGGSGSPDLSTLHALDRSSYGPDMVRCRAAAPTQHVDEAAGRKVPKQVAGLGRELIVFAERVREARVGIAQDIRLGEPRQLFEVRTHLARAERAVDGDGKRPGMTNGHVERIERLARQRATAAIGDGHRNNHRNAKALFLEHLFDRGDCRLGVQRVEDRLDEQQIGAAIDKAANLILVGRPRVVEGHPAERRVVHIRRNRERAVHRAHRSGHETALVGGPGRPLVGSLAGDPRTSHIQLVGERFEPVVRLRDRGARECIRLDDVRAGRKVLAVDRADDVRPCQDEEVAVALLILGVILEALAAKVRVGQLVSLNHRAHRAVEQEDSTLEERGQVGQNGVRHR